MNGNDPREAPPAEHAGDGRFAPPAAPLLAQAPGDARQRGSLWAGFGLFWLALVGSWFVSGLIYAALLAVFGARSSVFVIAYSAALLLPLALCLWLAVKGRSRTALGILLGYASVIGLALLLVSVCVGLIG
jgi:hypothetical protein